MKLMNLMEMIMKWSKQNLIKDLEALCESFIKLIASAIDAKSPYTGGHCALLIAISTFFFKSLGIFLSN